MSMKTFTSQGKKVDWQEPAKTRRSKKPLYRPRHGGPKNLYTDDWVLVSFST
jgi:hypothetical protein